MRSGLRGRTVTAAKDAVAVGAVQALSVLPGFSRSGLTVSTLLSQGYYAKQAVRVGFLMSIPVVLAAVVALSMNNRIDNFNLSITVGIVTALIFGWLTIGALLRIAERIPFWPFCLVWGVSLLPLIIETFII
jgi:undecaprenyl-diphosphatase